jgi:hypothetical protein
MKDFYLATVLRNIATREYYPEENRNPNNAVCRKVAWGVKNIFVEFLKIILKHFLKVLNIVNLISKIKFQGVS